MAAAGALWTRLWACPPWTTEARRLRTQVAAFDFEGLNAGARLWKLRDEVERCVAVADAAPRRTDAQRWMLRELIAALDALRNEALTRVAVGTLRCPHPEEL